LIGAENPRHLENKTMISSDETDAKSDAIADPSERLKAWKARKAWKFELLKILGHPALQWKSLK